MAGRRRRARPSRRAPRATWSSATAPGARCVVEEVDAGRRLSWRWWPSDDEPGAGASRVEITLTPAPAGTTVRVVETPLSAAPTATARASAGEAWSHRLLHLEALLLVAAAVRG